MSDAADLAAAIEEREMERFRHKRLEATPAAFPNANAVINCVDCGDVIPEARLRAVPRTLRCKDCAAEVER